MKAFAACLLAAFGISVCSAEEVPKALSTDSRLRVIEYNAEQVVKINALMGVATSIILEKGESIQKAAPGFGSDCGDAASDWCIVADVGENTVFVKPKSGAKDSNNLELKTNKRSYSFDFVVVKAATEKLRNAHAMFRVTFKYPDEEVKKNAVVDEKATIADRISNKNVPRNWNYAMEPLPGSDNIIPSMAYDDGNQTFLTFPNNREKPEIFEVLADGSEKLTNKYIDPKQVDTIVLERVYKRLVLRLGSSVVGIWNDSFDPDGIPPVDGVTVPGLKRVVRGQQ